MDGSDECPVATRDVGRVEVAEGLDGGRDELGGRAISVSCCNRSRSASTATRWKESAGCCRLLTLASLAVGRLTRDGRGLSMGSVIFQVDKKYLTVCMAYIPSKPLIVLK